MLPTNGNAWIPFLQSSKGFAILWNSAGYGDVSLANEPFGLGISFDAVRQIDYWVTTTAAGSASSAPPYRDLMKHYSAATGALPPVPHAYTGFWQSKLRYSSRAQVQRVVAG